MTKENSSELHRFPKVIIYLESIYFCDIEVSRTFLFVRCFTTYSVKKIRRKFLRKNLRKSHLSVDARAYSVLTLSLKSEVISITDTCRGADRSVACYGQLLRWSIPPAHRRTPAQERFHTGGQRRRSNFTNTSGAEGWVYPASIKYQFTPI